VCARAPAGALAVRALSRCMRDRRVRGGRPRRVAVDGGCRLDRESQGLPLNAMLRLGCHRIRWDGVSDEQGFDGTVAKAGATGGIRGRAPGAEAIFLKHVPYACGPGNSVFSNCAISGGRSWVTMCQRMSKSTLS
jgi:hypothetical protein